MRDLTDWHKKVDSDARAAQRALESARRAQLEPKPLPAERSKAEPRAELAGASKSGSSGARPTSTLVRKGRGPRKEESREELLSRLLDPTLTLDETARMLEVCPTTVRRYTNRGILPHDRSKGNQRRFKLSSVLAFMELQSKIGPQDTEEQ